MGVNDFLSSAAQQEGRRPPAAPAQRRSIKQKYKSAKSIFILPPSLEALRSRLEMRAQDSNETVEKRMKKAISESSKWTNFDYLVENDVFQIALEAIKEIISG